jgi:hypothetical protein
MANAKLLSEIKITALNGSLRVTRDGSDYTMTIPPGSYWWLGDGTLAEDFAKAWNDAWNTAVGSSDLGVSLSGPRPSFSGDGGIDYAFDWTHADTTMDPRLLGIASTATTTAFTAEYSAVFQHRYGWYPQSPLLASLPALQANAYYSYTTGMRSSVADFGEYFVTELRWRMVHRALVRIYAGLEASAGDVGLTTGDENAALERWGADVSRQRLKWRVYPDAGDNTTYSGPWRIPQSVIVRNPLGLSKIEQEAGEKWRVTIEGIEARD